MLNEDKIFEEYVLKRLTADQDLGEREYLDSGEFGLAKSESLSYLAEQSGVDLIPPEETWITENPRAQDDDNVDTYDGTERFYAITTHEILCKRQDNIERITQAFPESLANKILLFENHTRHLYAHRDVSSEEIVLGLRQALHDVEGRGTLQRLIIKHAERLVPPTAKKEQNKIKRETQKQVQTQRETDYFRYLITYALHMKNSTYKADVFKQILTRINHQSDYDVCEFLKIEPKSYTPKLRARITTELTRDIYEQLYLIYREAGHADAPVMKKKLSSYTKACNHYSLGKRLLGPHGAFGPGGIYGPDSKFANNANVNDHGPVSLQMREPLKTEQEKEQEPKKAQEAKPRIHMKKDLSKKKKPTFATLKHELRPERLFRDLRER